jgi:hypothetical protein
MNASPKSFFTSGTIILPVGATVPYNCTGQMFVCKESSDVFQMSFNDGEFFNMEVGLGFRLNGTDEFTKLSFQNSTQNIITIQFYVGTGEIRDARLNTVIDRLVVVGLKDVPDYAAGITGATPGNPLSASGIAASYAGTDPVTGKQRKQFTIQNVDSANYLYVTDASGRALAVLAPGQAWTMQSSGTFKVVKVPSGANCDYLVCQTFYNS